jgi:hypothetical protein
VRDSRSQAAFGPAQSTAVNSSVPNGPAALRSAINCASTVLGDPKIVRCSMKVSTVTSSSRMSGRALSTPSRPSWP